jgi:septum formation protein
VDHAFDLILASTSRYRRQLLSRLGLPFRVLSPACDEDDHKRAGLEPRALAEALALAKAQSLQDAWPQATIIGSDQVAAVEEGGGWLVLGKPGDAKQSVMQLARLSGQTHHLITALAVVHHGQTWRHTDVTRLTMRPLAEPDLRRYVEIDRPFDCAGAYKLEAHGIGLFSRIDSADHSAITGLPLLALTGILAEIGYAIPGAAGPTTGAATLVW